MRACRWPVVVLLVLLPLLASAQQTAPLSDRNILREFGRYFQKPKIIDKTDQWADVLIAGTYTSDQVRIVRVDRNQPLVLRPWSSNRTLGGSPGVLATGGAIISKSKNLAPAIKRAAVQAMKPKRNAADYPSLSCLSMGRGCTVNVRVLSRRHFRSGRPTGETTVAVKLDRRGQVTRARPVTGSRVPYIAPTNRLRGR